MNVELKNVSVAYGDLSVLEGFDLTAEEGKVLCLLGESGCGKTTILNCIAGVTPYTGTITGVPERVSYVFQTERLLKNLTVFENLSYVLRPVLGKEAAAREIRRVLEQVELADWADRYPRELSGGMAQRVSLARAFCYPSRLLLMDEPFRALDMGLKNRLLEVFLRLLEQDGRTVIFVTHDVDEALLAADRIALLEKAPARIRYECAIEQPRRGRLLSDGELAYRRADIYRSMGI